ncbi:MAG: hypothetical protein Q8P40_10985 [Nitrospirota bacterium]|nr:hypothetical protein [Nitrospirota bacterium]
MKRKKRVRRHAVGTNEFKVTETIKIDLLDLPPDKMASAYIQGHLIIQIQCTKKGAQVFIKNLIELDELQEQIENQQELLDQSSEMLKELKKRMDELNPAEPEEKESVMYA